MISVTKVVGKLLSSNMYILFEEITNICWIIDIGDFNTLMKHLPSNAYVKGLFLTHGHFDHIYDINKFHAQFPDATIYTSKYGVLQLQSEKKNFSYYHGTSVVYCGNLDKIHILEGNEIIYLSNMVNIHVLSTMGHCPSCLTYYTKTYLFTGDSYIPGTEVVTKLPNGDKEKAALSYKIIKQLSIGRIICPGHDLNKWESFF